MTSPVENHDTTLDPWHGAIVDQVCLADAARCGAGERHFTRLAVDHEACPPGGPCITWIVLVVVTEIAPGVRSRYLIPAERALA